MSCFRAEQDFIFWYDEQLISIYYHYHKGSIPYYKGMLTSEISSASADLQWAHFDTSHWFTEKWCCSTCTRPLTHVPKYRSLFPILSDLLKVFWKKRDREVASLIPTNLSDESSPLCFREHIKKIFHWICRSKPTVAHALLLCKKGRQI